MVYLLCIYIAYCLWQQFQFITFQSVLIGEKGTCFYKMNMQCVFGLMITITGLF